MKKLLLGGVGLLALTAAALSQVNVVPQIGVINSLQKQLTYSAVSIGLVPASAATDIFCISGSTTRSISIKRVEISGIAGTAISVPMAFLRRVSLDTGGTAATGAALPVATPNNPPDAAATAVLTAYTANPTIVDASPTYLRAAYLSFPLTTGDVNQLPWLFGEEVGFFSKSADIPRGVVGQYCINMNAATVSSGLINISISWTEQ